ncbi:MAG TPA: ribonuclease P protein component [Candidatus Saccharimonadales bacterium]|nr:ribonuclease P protein component [Candidatus Saccharimonadales bacterium]
MISREHRFHGLGSLRHVYRLGRTVRGPLFGVKILLNERRRTYRASVVVSRKINKSAVARNRMRRRLYELVRELGTEIDRPYDIVITVFNSGVADAPLERLRAQLKEQLHQAGVIHK